MITNFYNERDIEIPSIIKFIKDHPVNTALDVGAHWSHAYYAKQIRELLPNYDALDILPDPQTEAIVDKYWNMNVMDFKDRKYDLVICISSIEHAGITTYKVTDYKNEQLKVFSKLLELSNKYLFITFPFGKEALHEGQFANITLEQLIKFGAINKEKGNGFIKHKFYFSESPFVDKIPYREVHINFASNVEYLREKGTRCFCILTIEK